MGARLMNAKKKKKRLAHRDTRQKQREASAQASEQRTQSPKSQKSR
jgi:hypothetical protein